MGRSFAEYLIGSGMVLPETLSDNPPPDDFEQCEGLLKGLSDLQVALSMIPAIEMALREVWQWAFCMEVTLVELELGERVLTEYRNWLKGEVGGSSLVALLEPIRSLEALLNDHPLADDRVWNCLSVFSAAAWLPAAPSAAITCAHAVRSMAYGAGEMAAYPSGRLSLKAQDDAERSVYHEWWERALSKMTVTSRAVGDLDWLK